MRSRLLPILIAVVASLGSASVAFGYAFMLDDSNCVSTWPAGTIPMQVKLAASPTLTDGTNYQSSVLAAMAEWNVHLGTVQFAGTGVAAGSYALGNGTSEIVMDGAIDTGDESLPFGEDVLAVTLSFGEGNFTTEADIIFNTAYQWDSFRGGQTGSLQDIRRVAAHELGHVLGLGHPNTEDPFNPVIALMDSHVSYSPPIDTMQQDDIAGAEALYGYPGFVPANDNFSNATTLDLLGSVTAVRGTNAAATKETGEPDLDPDDPGGRTLWWKWTATIGGTLTVTTEGSRFDTLLGAFTGNAVNSLTQIAVHGDVESGVIRWSTITIDVSPGTTYYFAVDGWGGYVGPIRLNLNLNPDPQSGPPFFVRRPRSWNFVEGDTLSINLELYDSYNSTYEWKRNGITLASQTGSAVNLGPATLDHCGYYEVIATNARGSTRTLFYVDVAPLVGDVVGWGDNSFGKASPPEDIAAPYAIDAGTSHGLAVQIFGGVADWGSSISGRVGVTVLVPPAVSVAAGESHSLALLYDGYIVSWGTGPSDAGGAMSPARIPGWLSDVVAIAAGRNRSLALRADGRIFSWGLGGVDLHPELAGVVAIAAGDDHWLALKADGTVVGWGDTRFGASQPPAGLTGVVKIAAGTDSTFGGHSLALKSDGTVVAWGYNAQGQCNVPAGLTDVIAIAAGNTFSLALKSDGTVVVWGSNEDGVFNVPADVGSYFEISAGTGFGLGIARPNRPVIVTQPTDQIADEGASASFTVSVTGTPPLQFQWKRYGAILNNSARITGATGPSLTINDVVEGDAGAYTVEITNVSGKATSLPAILQVRALSGITARPATRSVVEGGATSFTVEVSPGGGPFTYAWKHNRKLLLGETSPTLSIDPIDAADAGYYEVLATNSSGITSSSVFYLTVAVHDAAIWEWGGSSNDYPPIDGPIAAIDAWGAKFALKGDGTVVRWGGGFHGSAVPEGLANVVGISVGDDFALALKSDGTVVGWGSNTYGESTPPAGLDRVVAISAGDDNAIALRSNGTVVTWGNPSEGRTQTPVPDGLRNVVMVKAVKYGFYAVRSNGSVVAWGNSQFGSSVPLDVDDIVTISAQESHRVAVTRDGRLKEWGSFSFYNSTEVSDVRAAVAGERHTIALKTDGTALSWGLNAAGETDLPAGFGGILAVAAQRDLSIALYRKGTPSVAVATGSLSAVVGDFLEIATTSSGTLPLTYQWKRNGVALVDGAGISGAGSSKLILDPVAATSAGTYEIVVTDGLGNSQSSSATLAVKVPPVFTERPPSRLVNVGQSVTLSAAVADAGPVVFEWRHNGTVIPGADGPSLSISAATFTDRGFYEVRASNAEATSRSYFMLHVAPAGPSERALERWGSNTALPNGLGQIVSIAAGSERAAVLRSDGTVKSWLQADDAVQVGGGFESIATIGLTEYQLLGARTDGTVVRQTFTSDYTTPVPLGLRNVVAVATQARACIALISDGSVRTWGMKPPLQPVEDAVAVALGAGGAWVLRSDGTVVGWATGAESFFHAAPAGLGNVVAVSAGRYHVTALRSNGTVVCWGGNDDGQLAVPPGLDDAIAVSAGFDHSLALRSNGMVVGWGHSTSGEVNPQPGLAPLAAVAAGARYSLGLTPVLVAPSITQHPQSDTSLVAPSTLELTSTAVGRPRPEYQWQKDGVNFPGATTEKFKILGVRLSDAGVYRLVASNSAGVAVSNPATVSVTFQVGYPGFSPPFGTLVSGEAVAITTGTAGATIRYTTDGSIPSRTNGIIYTGPVVITETTHLRAIAYLEGAIDSGVHYSAYPVTPNLIPSALASPMPRGVVGSSFDAALHSIGGNYGPRWSVAEGNLPAGLSLNPDGYIWGTPTSAGNYALILRLEDRDAVIGLSDEDTLQLSITVDSSDSVPAITTAALPDAGLSITYSRNLTATGGNGTLTWSLASGSLPPGLTLTPGGLISGIPQVLGNRTFTVRVADDDTITGAGDEATKELSINVIPAPRLTNVSMRAFAGAGDDTLVVGFYIAGTGQKTVLIRGIGPKLLDHQVPSVVADPRISLYKDQTVLATNNDWDASLVPVFIDAGAFALDVGSKDAAMTATLEPGSYTIHLVNNGPVAEALIEVYDISRDAGSRLVNVSSRLRFQPGQLAILGTAVTGGPISVLTRNVGPGIAEYLVNPLDALPDPKLALFAGQTLMSENDDWDAALLPFFGASGAFPLDAGSKDAAIRATFQIGGYTVHSTGNGGEGVAIIEIYESP